MKVSLFTYGSRGDFEPFLNLAIFLRKRGHEVLLGTTAEFANQVAGAGVPHLNLAGNLQDLIRNQGVSPKEARTQFQTEIKPVMVQAFEQVRESIVQDVPDVVVYHPKLIAAPIAARSVGAVSVVAELAPILSPTKEFAAAGIGSGDYGPLNRLTFKIVGLASALFSKEIRTMKEELRVSSIDSDYSMCPVSSCLLERPKDWPATTHLVGPWASANNTEVTDPALLEFLDQAPTAYIGFGSMSMGDPGQRTRVAIEAARRNGLQALIVTGWGGLQKLEAQEGVYFVDSVSHAVVLPKVQVAVHHGGAGTVHAALRAGVPSVVVPFIADQPWWGSLLHRRGLGSKPVPAKKLSVDRLEKAIAESITREDRVESVAQCMKGESPLETTEQLLLELLGRK